MKTLSDLLTIVESKNSPLSNDSLAKLTYLKRHLNDEDVDKIFSEYCPNADEFSNEFLIDFDKLTKILQAKGIESFGPVKDGARYILKLFRHNDNEKTLRRIIEGNGVSISDLKETGGNIFADLCKGWEEEAKEIAYIQYKTKSNVGPYEVLLKFLLNEASTGSSGDILIDNSEDFEVKCMTWKNTKSGGRLAGQKGLDGTKIRLAWSIYMYLNEKIFGYDKSDNYAADNAEYFQKESGFQAFLDEWKKNDITKEDMAKALVNAICFQYNFITNKRDKDGQLGDTPSLPPKIVNELCKQTENLLKSYDSITFQDMKDIIGCIQFNLYSFIEQFDYIFIGFLAENKSKQKYDGKYFFSSIKKNEIIDFSKIMKNLYFSALGKDSQGRTGKIYLKLEE